MLEKLFIDGVVMGVCGTLLIESLLALAYLAGKLVAEERTRWKVRR